MLWPCTGTLNLKHCFLTWSMRNFGGACVLIKCFANNVVVRVRFANYVVIFIVNLHKSRIV